MVTSSVVQRAMAARRRSMLQQAGSKMMRRCATEREAA